MTFDEYQKQANHTAMYGKDDLEYKLMYLCMGLAGESGEVIEKMKKVVRNDGGVVSEEKRQDFKKELGDVLWYLSQMAQELNLTLEEVAVANVVKLADRLERGVIKSVGDDR